MKNFVMYLMMTAALICAAMPAQATNYTNSYTFSSLDSSYKDKSGILHDSGDSDMRDLEHGFYYGWSIANAKAHDLGNDLKNGYVITSATLTFKNIYNWVHEDNDQLNSFLLDSPPPVPGKSEVVPVVIDGVAQGHNIYTYQKTRIDTTTNKTGICPTGYTFKSSVTFPATSRKPSYTTYTYTKTTVVSTKTNTTGIAPSGYTQVGEPKFKPDTVTLGDGIKLSSNLWERSDQQSRTDIDWGVGDPAENVFRIQDINGDPLNPWHDIYGGSPRKGGFDLVYNLDEASINKLFEYAVTGYSFGIGIDPDCHYYNEGIFFEVTTEKAPVPEPSTIILLGAGLLGVGLMRRKIKK